MRNKNKMLEKIKMHEEEIKKETRRDHQFSLTLESSHRLAIGIEYNSHDKHLSIDDSLNKRRC